MQVQRVVLPGVRVESWTVLGDDDVPVEPIDRWLGYLSDIYRSPNTVKAYAHDLKDYWLFLDHRGLDWREVRLEDIGEYVAWLVLPPAGRSGQVAVLASVAPQVGAATINRKLSALAAFYTHQARHGVDLGELLTTWQPGGGRGGWKPFLHQLEHRRPGSHRDRSSRLVTRSRSAQPETNPDQGDPERLVTRLRWHDCTFSQVRRHFRELGDPLSAEPRANG